MDPDEFFASGFGGGGGYPLTGDTDDLSGMNIVSAAAASAAASNPFSMESEFNQADGSGLAPGGPAAAPLEPVFIPERINYPFTRLVFMAVANKHVILAFATNKVRLLDLDSPANVEEVEVTRRTDDQILKVFIDPSGNHMLITTRMEENFYLHWGSKKVRPLPKMHFIIESVAWDMQNTSNIPSASQTVASLLGQTDGTSESSDGVANFTAAQTTRLFLIGTRSGAIYEACIEASTERRMIELMSKQDYFFRQIINLERPITGLRFELLPPTPDEPIKFFVMATTESRVYEFVGGPTFEAMMNEYAETPSFRELPPIEDRVPGVSCDQVAFYYRPGGAAQAFGWLAGPGLYFARLVYGTVKKGDTISRDEIFLPYTLPEIEHRPPFAVLLTEFHYILLYEHSLQCVNNLSKENVFEFRIHERAGQVRGLAQDPMTGSVWVFCDSSIYEIKVINEDRDAWFLFMQRKDWEAAEKHCNGDPHKLNIVYTAKAAEYFSAGTKYKYSMAAELYAKTHEPFEEVALMFINKDQRQALKKYLLLKLAQVPKDATTQLTVIATWLVEIYLNELNVLTDAVHEIASGPQEPDGSTTYKLEKAQDDLDTCKAEFRKFLSDYKGDEKMRPLHPATTFNLITSHGRYDDMVYYSELIGDYERVLSYYFREHKYKDVLDTLAKLTVREAQTVYKLSPSLISIMPVETVDCWMKLKFLEPKQLFPALIHYEETAASRQGEQENQAVRYLQYCVKDGNVEPAVHNYLLSLLAKKSSESGSVMDGVALLNFLNGDDGPVCYDLKYALRLCTKLNQMDACVLIYSKMGLYEDAVDLALAKGELTLAQEQADKPEDDGVRRRLWLKIAQKVVQQNNDVASAMEFLKNCDLLKIEDILPFFSEITRIDDFKEAICHSLEEYNQHMHELKTEMDGAKKAASEIRHKISDLRNRCGVVRAGQLCDHCHHLALTRNLYLFPCGHVFHIDCLIDFTGPLMTPERRKRVKEIISQISSLKTTLSKQGDANSVAVQQKSNNLRTQLDNLVAAECPLCGDMMIRLIEVPFIQPNDAAISQWAI